MSYLQLIKNFKMALKRFKHFKMQYKGIGYGSIHSQITSKKNNHLTNNILHNQIFQ